MDHDLDVDRDAAGMRGTADAQLQSTSDALDHHYNDTSSLPQHQRYGHDRKYSQQSDLSQHHFHDVPDAPISSSTHHPAPTSIDHYEPPPIDPDDFYKSYRVLPNGNPPDTLPMAPSAASQPSLRSTPDGTALNHPILPTSRSLPRPDATARSVSNPVDQRSMTTMRSSPSGKPSVKDLKKRFDQNSTDSSPLPRPLVRPRAVTRTKQDPSFLREKMGTSASSNSLLHDHAPNDPHSFASRIGKPPPTLNGNSMDAELLTRHANSPPPPPPAYPTSLAYSKSDGLLFGEILPEQRDDDAPGHGIEGLHALGISDAGSHDLSTRHYDGADSDAEPSSPSNWYRDSTDSQNVSHASYPARRHYRTRSQSDTANSSPSRQHAASSSSKCPPTSKIPRSVRKLSSPTGSASPPSTRSNSPSTARRPQTNGGRTTRASPPTSRAKTPTSQTKSPVQTPKSRREPPPPLPTTDNNSRLQNSMGATPSAKSPPLRSSRPRQPVSVASTASSRMKEVDRAKSPYRSNVKSHPKSNESTPRRRKISVGPIDFEQRREHIRLAYSKSLRESEANEARKKAAERRRRQLEVEEQTRAADMAAANDTNALSPATVLPDKAHHTTPGVAHNIMEPSAEQLADTAIQQNQPKSVVSITTSGPGLDMMPPNDNQGGDSPTLGIPGSFPTLSPPTFHDEPQSAISTTSATTEFDAEPQVHPPVPARSSPEVPITVVKPPSPSLPQPRSIPPPSEYQYPFEDSLHQGSVHELEAADSNSWSPAMGQNDVSASDMTGLNDNHRDGDSFKHHAYSTSDATVTIMSAPEDNGTQVSHSEDVPFPRVSNSGVSDCQSDTDGSRAGATGEGGTATDSCAEATDDQYRDDYRRSYSQFGDQPSSHRASTCASTDAGDDDYYYSYGAQQPHVPSTNGLAVPSFAPHKDRFSRQSAWTDFSVDSTDQSDTGKSPALPGDDSPSFGHVTIFKSGEYPSEDVSSRHRRHDSSSDIREPTDSNRSSTRFDHPTLPEVDTGDGFTIPYVSPGASASLSYLPSPKRDPPPIPTSVSGSALNSRTSSVFYDQSQRGSTMIDSGRGSDDYLSNIETPQSMDDTSITTDPYFGSETPADSDSKSFAQDQDEASVKERHRLSQRRNVIKELVDTEAVFVRDMNIVEEIYKGTAEACPKLDDQTVKLVFRNSHEIIEFHTSFLAKVKEAVAAVYIPKGGKSPKSKAESIMSDGSSIGTGDINDAKDRQVLIGPVFKESMEKMKLVHEGFLRNSDQAAKKLIQIQQDSTVKVWLNECNEVAKDLTAAWDLDSLLIKPMQRITKYPNLIITLLQHTPQDHPDREGLVSAKDTLETAIIEINKTKKNFELVGQIVGRKRKESDVKAGFARAFGKRVDKLQAPTNRPPEDPVYAKLNEKFGDDYLRLQVVLRDVEFYTRQVSAYVHEFLQYMSSIELVMRLQPGSYPEIESKWVQFNISVRDLEKVALEEHLSQVRKHVIEPFELVIKAYGNPSLAMKKRLKRRLDFERYEQLKRGSKSVDPKLKELVEQYEALNDTLKKELPKLSTLTEKVGNICLGNFVNIQARWYAIWKEKMKSVLGDCPDKPDLKDIVATFQRDFPYVNEQLANIGILNPTYRGRPSQSTTASADDGLLKARSRASDAESRGRRLSVNADTPPSLPTPDFARPGSGTFNIAVANNAVDGLGSGGNAPSPYQYYYKDYYSGIQTHSLSGRSPDLAGSGSRSVTGTGHTSTRPSTSRSFDSSGMARQSSEYANQHHRDSSTTYSSNYPTQEPHRYSNLFHSALPLSDGPEDNRESSRASSRERANTTDGYNVLWLAASLFEFNITTTKKEAGYRYLTYQAGEIFDVIAEKGELWLAKNQDDPTDQVGWIWSKHFAKLADS